MSDVNGVYSGAGESGAAEAGGGVVGRRLLVPALQEKLKQIKLFALDVDGILTDGRIGYTSEQAGWTRSFHTRDGYGLKVLMKCGISVAIISGGDSHDVRTRMEFLKIPHVFLGDENKVQPFERLLEKTGLAPAEVAFMGDELFDIPLIERVGFSATVPQAVEEVRQRVDYITDCAGGWGAVREVADAIRKAQKLGPYLV
jgi:3-deoxy-D-manno-octulosonate 8-phosphate phosphatase (KDO 8-P phosphatase)